MRDLIIGSITNYNFDNIKYWVNSLDTCGFTGTKAMLCYNISFDVVDELVKRGYEIFAFRSNEQLRRFEYRDNFSIVVERFLHLWFFLKNIKDKYRYIISTDVKDVVFQTNPSVWLENNLGNKEINVASESISYENEDWGNNNLLKSFGPLIHEHNKKNIVYNAGTISGKMNTVIDLFLNIYMLCNGTNHFIEGGGGPDQAALNVLLNLSPYKDITNFSNSDAGYAAQLGTTGPQIFGKYGTKLVDKCPIILDNMICTSDKIPFSIIHQYDRVPEWKKIIEEKYG